MANKKKEFFSYLASIICHWFYIHSVLSYISFLLLTSVCPGCLPEDIVLLIRYSLVQCVSRVRGDSTLWHNWPFQLENWPGAAFLKLYFCWWTSCLEPFPITRINKQKCERSNQSPVYWLISAAFQTLIKANSNSALSQMAVWVPFLHENKRQYHFICSLTPMFCFCNNIIRSFKKQNSLQSVWKLFIC